MFEYPLSEPKRQRYVVIGISDCHEQYFPPEVQTLIQAKRVFSGGVRHREIMLPYLPQGAEWIDITIPLKDVFSRYRAYDDIVIFASGDPLFFGFANTVRRECPDAEIRLYPSFNSLQMLAHCLLLPYHDMRVVSLTGRPWTRFDQALIEGEAMIGVLTDREKTPSAIARRMLDYGYDNYTMAVGEKLGNQTEENVGTYALSEVLGRTFAFPNNLILCRTSVRPRPFGIPEGEFALLDGRAKMITKAPVRLLSLSMLELRDRHVLWDIGFCTGSVSVEAKLQFPHLQVVAFEQRPQCEELISCNSRKFGTPGIEVCMGDFMQATLGTLPRPDAVFIGGHGGKLIEMLCRIQSVLAGDGVIVFNAVSEESRQLFESGIRAIGRRITRETRIQVDMNNSINVIKAE